MAQPFLTGRLGPSITALASDTAMSIVFLQSGGLSPGQIDQGPLPRPMSALRRWIAAVRGLRPAQRRIGH